MKVLLRRSLWVLVLLVGLLSSSALLSVNAQGGGNLDLILLVDSTGSAADTDPQALRIDASRFLLDYVQAVSEAQGLIQRFAAANFNTATLDEIPWTSLQGNAGRDQLIARSSGGTDFAPALEYALRLRQEPGGAEKLAVVLFTDGAPCPATPCPQGAVLEAYFRNLEELVASLQATGGEIFVVALGDNSTATNWSALVGASHYRFVDASTDLAGVYHDFFADLLGLKTDSARPLRDGDSISITVEPYLEQLVLSIIKTDPGAEVTVTDPFGGMPFPTRGGSDALHAVYAIPSPAAGRWQVRVAGGAAQVYVDRQYATLVLDAPAAPQALGVPVPVTGQLLRRGIAVVDDPDLHLNLSVTGPTGVAPALELVRKSGGRYQGALTNLQAEGVYTLTLGAEWGGQAAGARQIADVTVSLFAVPVLGLPELQGSLFVGEPLTVTVAIANADRIGPETEVFARLLRADGSTVETPALRDDGLNPDSVAGDGVFSAVLASQATEGRYRVECALQGTSRDGVALDALTPQQRLDVSSVPTPTPTSTPVIVPTATPGTDHFDVVELANRYPGLAFVFIATGITLGCLVWYLFKLKRENRILNLETRWKEVREKSQKTKEAFDQGDLTKGSQLIDQGITLIIKISEDTQEKAFSEAKGFFETGLPVLRRRNPDMYMCSVAKHASCANNSVVSALAESMVRDGDGKLRPVAEVMGELYQVLSRLSLEDCFLLQAIAGVKNAPVASLCALIYEASISPTPDFEGVIRGIETHLGKDGTGLRSTYELIAFMAKEFSQDTQLQTYYTKALEETNVKGPPVLHEALQKLEPVLFANEPVSTRQFTKAIESLREISSRRVLPELRFLRLYLDQWKAYNRELETRAQDAVSNLSLSVYPSLSLRLLEQLEDSNYYEEFNEKGVWLIKVPIMVENHGDGPIVAPLTVSANSNGSIRISPKDIELQSLKAYSAEILEFRAQAFAQGTIEFRIDNTDESSVITCEYFERSVQEEKLPFSGTSESEAKVVSQQLEGSLVAEQSDPKDRLVFLRMFPGMGRTALLKNIANQLRQCNNIVVVFLDMRDIVKEKPPTSSLIMYFWHRLLIEIKNSGRVYANGQHGLKIPKPEGLEAGDASSLMEVLLEGAKLVVILDNVDALAASDEKWLALEKIVTVSGGAVVAVCDRTKQPREQKFWDESVSRDQERYISLLDEDDTYILAQQHIPQGKSLTELAHKGIWIYSGGHIGIVIAICKQIDSNSHVLLGLDDVKESVRKIRDDTRVKDWYSGFTKSERCVLDVLARGGFIDEGTGLVKGLRKPQNGSGVSWLGLENLQKYLLKQYPDEERGEWSLHILQEILDGFVARQVMESVERQSANGTFRWRMGWVYVMARFMRVER